MKEKLVVIDIEIQDVSVNVYEITDEDNVDEEFIRNLGFDPDYCHWFFSTSFNVQYHTIKERYETA